MFNLSQDVKARIDSQENRTENQVKLERVIRRVYTEYGLSHHPITESVRSLFKAKLWRMGQRLAKVGSIKRKSILDSWKVSTWEIHVDAAAVNIELIRSKEICEQQLSEEKQKRMRVENDLRASQQSLSKETCERQQVLRELKSTKNELKQVEKANEQLKKSNKRLSSEVVAQGNPKKRRRSDLTTVSRQQQWFRRKQIQSDIQQSLLFLEDEGACATSITLVHSESKHTEVINLQPNSLPQCSSEQGEVDSHMNMVLYVKERFGLSNAAYHQLSMVCQQLPRSWKLKDLTKKLNSKWDIKPCPGNDGVQQSLESRLRERVSHLLLERKVKSGDTLQVKLSGDGTKVCRKLNVINFTFTLLNEGEIAMSPKGNYTIAIINSTESYDVLATTLSDICDEVKTLTSIEVSGHTFHIEYFLCSDWKFLAIICGLESATSTYACIWCRCPSGQRYNMSKEWSITDPKKGARTIAEITACHTMAKSSSKRYNCAHAPLFPTIPLDHVVPDVLHLFLRVTDVLFNLLVTDIRRQDGIERCVEELSATTSMSKLEAFLNDTCHIPFKFAICKETKMLKWRDLMGPEKLTLLDKINLPVLIPHLPNVDAVQALWKDFNVYTSFFILRVCQTQMPTVLELTPKSGFEILHLFTRRRM